MVRGPQNPAIGCVSWQIGFLHAAMWALGPVEGTAGALGYRLIGCPSRSFPSARTSRKSQDSGSPIPRRPPHKVDRFMSNRSPAPARRSTPARHRKWGAAESDERALFFQPTALGPRKLRCAWAVRSEPASKKKPAPCWSPLEARDTRGHWPNRSVLGPRCDKAQPDRSRNGFKGASRTPWVDGGLIGGAPPPVLLNGTYHEREIRPLSIDNSDPRQLTEAVFEIGCVGIVQLQA